jgi:DNA invertase Pin-like site-specific DNA recombinase
MTQVAGYVRVSSENQINGTSLNIQQDRIQRYCQLKELELVNVYVDPGISGSIPISDRPEGSRLMESIRKKEISGIIISKLDRMFRSTIDCLQTVDQLDLLKVSLHIIDLGGTSIDSQSITGRFMLTVFAAAIEMEKGQIRERVASGRGKRIREQKRIGTIPFGYKLGEDNQTLIPNAKEYKALQLIRELRPQGISLPRIASTLNQQGYLTKHGKSWTHGHVQGILRRVSI